MRRRQRFICVDCGKWTERLPKPGKDKTCWECGTLRAARYNIASAQAAQARRESARLSPNSG